MAFSKFKPFMAYLDENDLKRMRAFAKKTKMPMSRIIREGAALRIAGENAFSEGYNQGINKAIAVVHDMEFAKMRFPSGASFAEAVETEMVKHMWREPPTKKKEATDEEARSVP